MSIITRKIDELGRVVVPSDMRRALRIRPGDEISFVCDGVCIYLTKTMDGSVCSCCGAWKSGLLTIMELRFCAPCLAKLKRLAAQSSTI